MLRPPLVPSGRFSGSVATNKAAFVSGDVNETHNNNEVNPLSCEGRCFGGGGSALLVPLAQGSLVP